MHKSQPNLCHQRPAVYAEEGGASLAMGIFNMHPVYVKLSRADTSITGAKRR